MVESVDPVGKQYVPLPFYAYWITEAQSEGIFVPNFLSRMKKQILNELLLFTKKKMLIQSDMPLCYKS